MSKEKIPALILWLIGACIIYIPMAVDAQGAMDWLNEHEVVLFIIIVVIAAGIVIGGRRSFADSIKEETKREILEELNNSKEEK